MTRPVWFNERRLGGVPVHWSPRTWQGWVVVAACTLSILGLLAWLKGASVLPVLCIVAITIMIAALTSARN